MFKVFYLFSLAGLGVVSSVLAEVDPLVAQIDAYIVTMAPSGEEVLKLAEVANPGDVILYRAIFENQSDVAISDVRPVIPIPVGLDFVADSVTPTPQEASIDGSTYQAYPVLDSAGQPVAPVAYRAFRWEVGTLKAGAPFTAELRAKLVQ